MHLRKILVSSSLFPAIRLEFPNSIGSGGATVVLGLNASGKTVLATAIRAALSKDEERWRDDLVEMGLQHVEIDFALQQWSGHLTYVLPEGRREIHWEKREHTSPAWPHAQRTSEPFVSKHDSSLEPPEFVPSELLPLVHLACAGRLDVFPDDHLVASVVQTVCAPLERELAGWQVREAHLCGGEAGGRLGAAREELARAEANLHQVEDISRRLEEARTRRSQWEARAAQLHTQSDVLAQEMVVQEKLVSLAERAALLDGWIAEIAAESVEVQQLRRRHVDLQTQLDGLEERFRGVSNDVLLHAHEFLDSGRTERELIQRTQDLQSRRAEGAARLGQLRRNLEALSEPAPDQGSRLQTLREEQDRVNGELDGRLRARIELLRRREGLAERLQNEFPSFIACDNETLAVLRAWLSGEDEPQRKPEELTMPERQRHVQEVQTTLDERFAGFDRVLATTETVRDYHELQRSSALLRADLESLHRRARVIERKIHPLRAAVVAILAAVAVFALGAVFFSWDIAVFAAVCASGIALLSVRWVVRPLEAMLKASRAAAVSLENKLQEARATIEKTSRALGPLAALEGDVAIARLTEYRRLCDLRDLLEQEIREDQAPRVPQDTAPLQLPPDLRALDRQLLKRRLGEYEALRRAADNVDFAWREFEANGAESRRMGELEMRLIELRQQLEATFAEGAQQNTQREGERHKLEQLIAQCETDERSLEDPAPLHEELEQLRRKRAEYRNLIGGDVTEEHLAGLQEGEHLRGELQTQLRDIRDRLSHRQNAEDLAGREAILREEATTVKQKVQTLDPLYLLVGTVADYSAKYTAQLRTLRQETEQTASSLDEVQRELQELSVEPLAEAVARERSLDDLQHAVSECRRNVEDVERDLMTTRELIASIQAELSEAEPTVRTDLFAEINRHMQTLSEQRFVALSARDGRWIVESADGAARSLNSLSDGTRDLVFLAVRMGILECVKKVDSNPVVWDEVLLRQDERNLDTIRDAVIRLAASRQVVLLSRQPQMETWGQVVLLGAEYSPENVPRNV